MPYIPHTSQDIEEMLKAIGVAKIEDLFSQIPGEFIFKKDLKVPSALSEAELSEELSRRSARNTPLHHQISFLGAGAYENYIPAVVDALSLRGEYFTSYTPYQAEASQGNLQVFFEFQSLISRLTEMDVANASLYDGSTALCEAVLMALDLINRPKVLLSQGIHPEYREVISTYLKYMPGVELVEVPLHEGSTCQKSLEKMVDDKTACVVYQNPNFLGVLEDGKKISDLARSHSAFAISTITDPLSLSMVRTPAEDGAHIACGEAQSLGNPLSLGGPSLGFLSTRTDYIRRMPGRIVGETVDKEGKRAFVLTLQTREQHIRREKATSNICTNQALLALRTTIYLSTIGKQGFAELGELCFHRAHYLFEKITTIPGFKAAYNKPFFREFALECPRPAREIVKALEGKKILPGVDLGRFSPDLSKHLLICVSEKNTKEQMDQLVQTLKSI